MIRHCRCCASTCYHTNARRVEWQTWKGYNRSLLYQSFEPPKFSRRRESKYTFSRRLNWWSADLVEEGFKMSMKLKTWQENTIKFWMKMLSLWISVIENLKNTFNITWSSRREQLPLNLQSNVVCYGRKPLLWSDVIFSKNCDSINKTQITFVSLIWRTFFSFFASLGVTWQHNLFVVFFNIFWQFSPAARINIARVFMSKCKKSGQEAVCLQNRSIPSKLLLTNWTRTQNKFCRQKYCWLKFMKNGVISH